ncbi:MAG: hypothetical protein V4692_02800 [Bdellovibrionota bacterium]
MAVDEIPADVRAFISRFIRSVGHLELLLFIFDARERTWSVDDLVREMRTNASLVEQQLKDLSGPIRKVDSQGFQFDIKSPETMEIVRRVSEHYRTRRHAMISEVYAQPLATIQSFADAFKIKKD